MTQVRALIGPIHGRRFDLALALALLDRAVKAHRTSRRQRHGLRAVAVRAQAFESCGHAKPLGA